MTCQTRVEWRKARAHARGARSLSLSHSRAPAPHHPADVPPLETLDDLDAARDREEDAARASRPAAAFDYAKFDELDDEDDGEDASPEMSAEEVWQWRRMVAAAGMEDEMREIMGNIGQADAAEKPSPKDENLYRVRARAATREGVGRAGVAPSLSLSALSAVSLSLSATATRQVVHGPLVAVRERPSVQSRMLGGKRRGDVFAVEWSLEGMWVKLKDQPGWMLTHGAQVGLGLLVEPVPSDS